MESSESDHSEPRNVHIVNNPELVVEEYKASAENITDSSDSQSDSIELHQHRILIERINQLGMIVQQNNAGEEIGWHPNNEQVENINNSPRSEASHSIDINPLNSEVRASNPGSVNIPIPEPNNI